MRYSLDTPLRTASRSAADFEERLGIRTVDDLLHYYPREHRSRADLTPLGSLLAGEYATVIAQVERVESRPMRQRKGRMLTVVITDQRARMTLTFFHKWFVHEKLLAIGARGIFTGKVGRYRGGYQLTHPEYEILPPDADGADRAARLIPIYRATKGITSAQIGRTVAAVLDLVDLPDDPIPERVRRSHRLLDLATAIRDIHTGISRPVVAKAKERLKWDEALALQVTLAQRRHAARSLPGTARPPCAGGLREAFEARLEFTLTAGQLEIGAVIAAEIGQPEPMQRLLQGEVGSGKTVVALRAMLQVVDAGGQAALLAPTEVLAAQHARTVRAMLGPLARAGELDAAEHATAVVLLTGSMSIPAKRQALLDVASGAAGIVIGTHALIQQAVSFADLGLVVIDEQHRFGVEQRDALRGKADRPPHLLVMTATPIPRTVAMTVFGDLETSALRELPQGRAGIATSVVPCAEKPGWLDRAWQRVREEVAAGHRCYVVCPRISSNDDPAADTAEAIEAADGDETPAGEPADPGDIGGAAARRPPLAVSDVAPELAEGPLAGLRIAVLHGRLPAEEKEQVLVGFGAGQFDVLVATTVIEVGVDVPAATVMVIMDADSFGVSQLHQLRGRVGRGSAPGLCLLVTESPEGSKARERLAAVASTTDGFDLARVDLRQRREGDVLGAAQSGRRSSIALLSLLDDAEIIAAARAEATGIVAEDPALERHRELARAVARLAEADRAEFLAKA